MIQTRSAYRKIFESGEGEVLPELVKFLKIIDDGGTPTRTEARMFLGLLEGKELVQKAPLAPEVVQ